MPGDLHLYEVGVNPWDPVSYSDPEFSADSCCMGTPGWDCYLDTSNLISGCNDSAACNYDPTAQIGDGSCYYGPGCTDPQFL